MCASLDGLLQDIRQRDARDAGRSVAPLQKDADARLLDTTHLSLDQAVDQVVQWANQALRQQDSSC